MDMFYFIFFSSKNENLKKKRGESTFFYETHQAIFGFVTSFMPGRFSNDSNNYLQRLF